MAGEDYPKVPLGGSLPAESPESYYPFSLRPFRGEAIEPPVETPASMMQAQAAAQEQAPTDQPVDAGPSPALSSYDTEAQSILSTGIMSPNPLLRPLRGAGGGGSIKLAPIGEAQVSWMDPSSAELMRGTARGMQKQTAADAAAAQGFRMQAIKAKGDILSDQATEQGEHAKSLAVERSAAKDRAITAHNTAELSRHAAGKARAAGVDHDRVMKNIRGDTLRSSLLAIATIGEHMAVAMQRSYGIKAETTIMKMLERSIDRDIAEQHKNIKLLSEQAGLDAAQAKQMGKLSQGAEKKWRAALWTKATLKLGHANLNSQKAEAAELYNKLQARSNKNLLNVLSATATKHVEKERRLGIATRKGIKPLGVLEPKGKGKVADPGWKDPYAKKGVPKKGTAGPKLGTAGGDKALAKHIAERDALVAGAAEAKTPFRQVKYDMVLNKKTGKVGKYITSPGKVTILGKVYKVGNVGFDPTKFKQPPPKAVAYNSSNNELLGHMSGTLKKYNLFNKRWDPQDYVEKKLPMFRTRANAALNGYLALLQTAKVQGSRPSDSERAAVQSAIINEEDSIAQARDKIRNWVKWSVDGLRAMVDAHSPENYDPKGFIAAERRLRQVLRTFGKEAMPPGYEKYTNFRYSDAKKK